MWTSLPAPRICRVAPNRSESGSARAPMQVFLTQVLNGLQLSMLMSFIAAGLTVIFGQMNILNLPPGAFFTLGAYCGVVVAGSTGSFWLALLVGPLLPLLLGVVLPSIVVQAPAE